MGHSTQEKACLKLAERRNRLRLAVEALKKDLRQDAGRSGDYVKDLGKEAAFACQSKIAAKPFISIAAAFAAGILAAKCLKNCCCRRNG